MEQDKRQLLPFFLCTASVMLILTGMLGIFSLFPYLYTRSLTAAHAEEFKRFLESSGLPEGENAEIRVLRYRKNRARVSFLSADGKRESVCTFLREDRRLGRRHAVPWRKAPAGSFPRDASSGNRAATTFRGFCAPICA